MFTIQLWSQLPGETGIFDAVECSPYSSGANCLEMSQELSCKPSDFRERVRKVMTEAKWRCGENHKKM
jgi:hypothetical protein